MARINLYAQNRHIFILDGIPLQGFADGDWLEVKKDGGAAARTNGGDGPAMNISTEQGGSITLSLLPTSPALGSIYAIRDQQAKTPRLFGAALVTGVEEIITAGGCAFSDLPQFTTGGDKMTPRKFLIECLEIKLDNSVIETVTGGFAGGMV